MKSKKAVGKMFKMAREKKGISQLDIAKKYNYSTAQIVSNWERGMCYPPKQILPKLCSMLDIDPNVIREIRMAEFEKSLGL